MRNKNHRIAYALGLLPMLLLWSGATWAQSNGALTGADFGMQCGTSTVVTSSQNCQPVGGQITLPKEPGLLRLWDSQVQWSDLNTSNGMFNTWGLLDEYLIAIASDPTAPAVIYTFGDVPCWDVSGSCTGSGTFPKDIGGVGCGTGSCAFNAFIAALMQHCTAPTITFPTGVCVKDVIKYYEMWNEFDNSAFWGGSVSQLYNMVASGVTTLHSYNPGAIILTPSVSGTGESSMVSWVQQEAQHGLVSNYYNFHIYLGANSPESTWLNSVQQNLSGGGHGLLYPNYHGPSPWKALPWLISETNFVAQTNGQGQLIGFACTFTQADCIGQVARWQVLVNANGWSAPANTNGGVNLSWYWWKATIGDLGSGTIYATPYYYMQLYLNGGTFPSSCSTMGSLSAAILTCPFTERTGTTGEWVWTNSENGLNYTVPSGYVDYRSITGAGKTCVTANQVIGVSVKPILLEKGTSCP